ncbi:hypothetical protein HXX76_014106 [Chlamydomonas incerta]|uniref:Nudix hydrolase domain-containing protein n=1 Tax=Chlamydomonas incerta TaxID=51695 RepID=A0A835VT67_CHLIN|nr:hypothetical protein HXX76_014106 [Chlamydomonas incerta]|eukprot:KAG2424948.1 hypothetical protein HXX76_014106 [Chlamydomonas incerta]
MSTAAPSEEKARKLLQDVIMLTKQYVDLKATARAQVLGDVAFSELERERSHNTDLVLQTSALQSSALTYKEQTFALCIVLMGAVLFGAVLMYLHTQIPSWSWVPCVGLVAATGAAVLVVTYAVRKDRLQFYRLNEADLDSDGLAKTFSRNENKLVCAIKLKLAAQSDGGDTDPLEIAADPGNGAAATAADPGNGAAATAADPGNGAATATAADPGNGAATATAADPGNGAATATAADPGNGAATATAADPGNGAATATAADPGNGAATATAADPGNGAATATAADPGNGAATATAADPGNGAATATAADPGNGAATATAADPGNGAATATAADPGNGAATATAADPGNGAATATAADPGNGAATATAADPGNGAATATAADPGNGAATATAADPGNGAATATAAEDPLMHQELIRSETFIEVFHKKNVFYLAYFKADRDTFKLGATNDIGDRTSKHRSEWGPNFRYFFVVECAFNFALEDRIIRLLPVPKYTPRRRELRSFTSQFGVRELIKLTKEELPQYTHCTADMLRMKELEVERDRIAMKKKELAVRKQEDKNKASNLEMYNKNLELQNKNLELQNKNMRLKLKLENRPLPGTATKRDHISSYGIICVRPNMGGAGSGTGACEYLMVQRKDSICYVDFVRGKYNLFDLQYIMRLLSGMTAQERSWLLHRPFSTIWQKLWMSNKRFNQEFHVCKDKFETLRTGFTVSLLNGASQPLSLAALIASADPPIRESEWEFPKGRRASNETPIACALREFEEESGVDCRTVCVVPDCTTTLSKLGCNDIMYRPGR